MSVLTLILVVLRFWLFAMILYLGIKHRHAKEARVDLRALGAWGASGMLLTVAFWTRQSWLIAVAGGLIDVSLAWLILTTRIKK
jgi:hypothetical protein